MDQELQVQIDNCVLFAKQYEISSAEQFENGSKWLSVNEALQKQVEATFEPIIEKQNAALKETRTQMKLKLLPLQEAETLMKNTLMVWHRKEEARIKAEQEEKRAQAEREAEQRRLDQAVKAEERGDSKLADKILTTPFKPIPTPAVSAPPKAKGFSVRQEADFEITDESLVPREYLEVNSTKIRGVVRALKMDAKIPGVRVFMKDVASQR